MTAATLAQPSVAPPPGYPRNRAEEFLEAILVAAEAVKVQRRTEPESGDDCPNVIAALRRTKSGSGSSPDAECWWSETAETIWRQFPDADDLALEWFVDVVKRKVTVARLRPASPTDYFVRDSATDLLAIWVERRCRSESGADRVAQAIHTALTAYASGRPWGYGLPAVVSNSMSSGLHPLVNLLEAQLRNAPHRLPELTLPLVRCAAMSASQFGGVWLRHEIIGTYAPILWYESRFSDEDKRAVILAECWMANQGNTSLLTDAIRPFVSVIDEYRIRALQSEAKAVVDNLLDTALLAGEIAGQVQALLRLYRGFRGFDDFKRGALWLDRWATGKPDEWAVDLLQSLGTPVTDDFARASELAGLKPTTLFSLGFLVPHWSQVVARASTAPEVAGIVALASWTVGYVGGCSPWCSCCGGVNYGRFLATNPEWKRKGIKEAVAATGEERLRKLLKLKLVRIFAREACFTIEAALGWNAADVEARFLKRDKWAVVALGLLPDEGDVRDRFLAIKRFAEEARKFGPQRRASEEKAAQAGLTHLAVTAGYSDLSAFEMAMESELADELDPLARRWTVGDYELSIASDEEAALIIRKAGKPLRAVPRPVRVSPEYGEARKVRGELLAQLARLRRQLETAMIEERSFDGPTFARMTTLPAGRLLLPRLVLRCWRDNQSSPIDLFDGRTIEDAPIAAAEATRIGVAHPRALDAAGTLGDWQRHLVETGATQPFNQLFRGLAAATYDKDGKPIRTVQSGVQVRLGALRQRLGTSGWTTSAGYGFARRFPHGVVAELYLADDVSYGEATEIVTVADLTFQNRRGERLSAVDPLVFTEAARDVDLAVLASVADRATGYASPELIALRASLVEALVPAAAIVGDEAHVGGGIVRLSTGAATGPRGEPLPAASSKRGLLPVPGLDPVTVEIAERVLALAKKEGRR